MDMYTCVARFAARLRRVAPRASVHSGSTRFVALSTVCHLNAGLALLTEAGTVQRRSLESRCVKAGFPRTRETDGVTSQAAGGLSSVTAGSNVTLTLAPSPGGTMPNFLGWLVQAPQGGQLSSPSVGLVLQSCGVCHANNYGTNSVSFTMTAPTSGSSLTLNAFIVVGPMSNCA
jgi:hypothetical protein